MSAVEEIKERASILDVISPFVPLKKAGRSYKGLCPFHSEKTPSFLVFPDKGNYHCFGCGANGDVFTFLMKAENVDFPEALRLLAERTGVLLPERGTPNDADEQNARLYQVTGAAAQYFNHLLLRSEDAHRAREYLARRGIATTTIEAFQLGYAPDSWDALSRFLCDRNYEQDEILAAGLTVERDDGRRYDRFRGRLTFPVRDVRGRVTGFGARTLGEDQPKYLNSPQTSIFDKGGSLFAIDLARGAIRDADRVVVVEGYVDALMSHQCGVHFTVACLGTALTERQLAILKRSTKHLFLALDPDTAGDEATLRGLEVAQQVFDQTVVPVPNWRGLMHFEQKLDADIRIVALPRGTDPDELIRADDAEWRRLIETAQPLVDYVLAAILSKADLSSAKGKEAAFERLIPTLRELGPGLQQEHYLQQLAQQLRISERTLAGQLIRWRDPGPARAEVRTRKSDAPEMDRATAGGSKTRHRPSIDEYLLALFIRYPTSRGQLTLVEPEELRHEASRQLLLALQQSNVSASTSLEELITRLDPALASVVIDLVAGPEGEPLLTGEEVERELTECQRELRRRNLRLAIEELSCLLQEAEQDGDHAARRRYISQHHGLLAELLKYEHNSAKARVWRM